MQSNLFQWLLLNANCRELVFFGSQWIKRPLAWKQSGKTFTNKKKEYKTQYKTQFINPLNLSVNSFVFSRDMSVDAINLYIVCLGKA